MFWIWFFFLIGVIFLLSLLSGLAGILTLLFEYLKGERPKRDYPSSETPSETPMKAEEEYGESSATLDMQDEEDKV